MDWLIFLIIVATVIYAAMKATKNKGEEECSNVTSKSQVNEFAEKTLEISRENGNEIDGTYVSWSKSKDLPYYIENVDEQGLVFDEQPLAFKGYPNAMLELMFCYSQGLHCGKNNNKVLYWRDTLIDFAEQGNRDAQAALCSNFYRTIASSAFGTDKGVDDSQAFREKYFDTLLSDAENGDKYAQYGIGTYCVNTEICADNNVAFDFLLKASEQGVGDAYYEIANRTLGQIYYHRDGTTVPWEEQMKYFKLGAEMNNGLFAGECQYHLAREYEDGGIVPKNLDEAKKWYKIGASNGHSLCMHFLERM